MTLSPYAVEVRYDNSLAPDTHEAHSAIGIAEKVYGRARQTVDLSASRQNDRKDP